MSALTGTPRWKSPSIHIYDNPLLPTCDIVEYVYSQKDVGSICARDNGEDDCGDICDDGI